MTSTDDDVEIESGGEGRATSGSEIRTGPGTHDRSDSRSADRTDSGSTVRADPDSTPTKRNETSPERRLEDELGRIDLLTTPEGYVEGRVTGLFERDATTVTLEVTLPHDEVIEFDLEKPIPWSSEFLFARIVEDVGYDASSLGHLIGESIYVARTDAGPTADDEDPKWWISATKSVGNVLLSALGNRYRLEEDPHPEWRLVDPLERPSPSDTGNEWVAETVGVWVLLLGTLLGIAGAVVWATGGVVITGSLVGYVLPGIVLTLVGTYLILTTTTK